MKYYAFTSSPESFVDGSYTSLILRTSREDQPDEWVYIAEVEVDIESVDMNAIRSGAVSIIDNQMEKQRVNFTKGMEQLETRKQNLLSITHQGAE